MCLSHVDCILKHKIMKSKVFINKGKISRTHHNLKIKSVSVFHNFILVVTSDELGFDITCIFCAPDEP
jgi:hypothetical protein